MDAGKRNCEEDSEMNFTAFSAVGGAGTHFITTAGQLPVAKLQQNITNNGGTMQQVVGVMGGVSLPDGMQYVRTLDGGATLQTPQLITVPIALPGAKPGDPQPTVQIQVLSPNLTLQAQQQPKYQMQIPIQGYQQGGAVLTLAYSPENNEQNGIQLVGNAMPDGTIRIRPGVQVLTAVPQEINMDTKEQILQNMQRVYEAQNTEIVVESEQHALNNNTRGDNNNDFEVHIKEERIEKPNDNENSQGSEGCEGVSWRVLDNTELVKYLNSLPPQEAEALPPSLQQYIRLNMKRDCMEDGSANSEEKPVLDSDGVLRVKKKKKYKKKPPKPARPKPGQVVIAKASDGTAVYCCPECQMAYPAKEQLEMHLIGHKIERRFICGICGAGLKRKEHLERHKLGHNPERPYQCKVCNKGFKRREHLNLHAVIHSGIKTEHCAECGKGFYRKDHLRKHARSHESRRARDGQAAEEKTAMLAQAAQTAQTAQPAPHDSSMPGITIHVPTSSNAQMPIQISIPQHVVSSLQAQNAPIDAHSQLDALLADNS
ncbi:PREDICTED: zinc finger protein 81-like isoform X3 [Papilio xuthus]|uniref:Zinc finger protein 81-like isoform X3 n=1 Tax=Papilio xuthus TaxID=66420 RepID=A0AAJ7EAA6_PAPXU|nr:PREDICTED: zinc finger protein 81-like isoform X3 [Papilio xuthus]